MKVLMLHGINHNMFGKRDPAQYGTITLEEINASLHALGKELGAEVECFQTNSEREMCERIHQGYRDGVDAVLINAGAWTHYSRAIADAFAVDPVPAIEIHLSDVENREDWRKVSVFDGLVTDKVSGKGIEGYREALILMKDRLGISGD